jgi:hypothetical protein
MIAKIVPMKNIHNPNKYMMPGNEYSFNSGNILPRGINRQDVNALIFATMKAKGLMGGFAKMFIFRTVILIIKNNRISTKAINPAMGMLSNIVNSSE